ncbi:MAG: MFS transporter [Tumebacillaceae bacterium]
MAQENSRRFPRSILRMLPLIFLIEFTRAAFLMSYLPGYGVSALGFSVSIVGVAVTAHYAADTLLKIGIGYLLDRYRMRWILPAGVALALLSFVSLAFGSTDGWLTAATTLSGIGLSPVWLVCMSDMQEAHRATQMGAIYTAWMSGMGAGLFLTNFLLDTNAQLVVWLLIGLLGVSLLLSMFLSAPTSRQAQPVAFRAQLRELYARMKHMGPLLPGMVLQTLAAGMLVPVLPSFVSQQMGLTYSQYSLLLLVGGACAVLGLIPMGRLSDQLGQKWFLIGGFGVLAVGLCFLSGSRSYGYGLMWAVVLGSSYASVLPAWNALLASQVSAEQQSVSWGVFASVEGIGVMLGPMVGGWLGDFFSWRVTLLASAGLMAAIALFYAIYPLEVLRRKSHSMSVRR